MTDSMAKVFIFNNYKCNLSDGGPGGVIAHNLLDHSSDYYYVNPVHTEQLLLRHQLMKKYLPLPVHPDHFDWYCQTRRIYQLYNVSKYPVVYFHDVYSMAFCMDIIPSKQKVVLQSHSPELPHQELSALSAPIEMIDWARREEINTFHRANFLIFPNEGIIDVYSSIIPSKSTIRYLVTGVKAPDTVQMIPLDPAMTYLFYVGRRNGIKGFDILIDAFRRARSKNRCLVLIVAGSGEQIIEDGVIDIGFTTRIYDWLASCDYVVNCNRQSYFDLSLLQAFAVGSKAIIAANFGHNVYKSITSGFVYVTDGLSVESLENLFLQAVRKNTDDKISEKIKELHALFFSDTKYRHSLEQLCIEFLSSGNE